MEGISGVVSGEMTWVDGSEVDEGGEGGENSCPTTIGDGRDKVLLICLE